MLLTSLIEFAEWNEGFTGGLIFLDFEKAFDSIEWTWLFASLEARGLPPFFVNIIRMLYDSPRASLIINGFRAHPFTVGRGVRQGCPLSPLLFALAIEPLADFIRSSPAVKGIPIPHSTYVGKISLFADDAPGLINSSNVLISLYKILDLFAQASGLKLNTSKVVGLWLSPSAIPPPDVLPLCTWLNKGEVERVLGFRIGIGVSPAMQHQHVLEKMRTRLTTFSSRAFTIKARTQVKYLALNYLTPNYAEGSTW